LDKTIYYMRESFALASLVISMDQSFWFVNLAFAFRRYISALALKCGEFSSTEIWIRGMASNFNHVAFGYFRQKTKNAFPKTSKFKKFAINFLSWMHTRFIKPRAIFISSIRSNQIAVRDALSGSIPCVGILDTNARSKFCTIPIPANDDSVDCLVFYNSLFSEIILMKKLSVLLIWFYNIKHFSRKISFNTWMSGSLSSLHSFSQFFSRNTTDGVSLYTFSANFLMAMNSYFNVFSNKLTIKFDQIVNYEHIYSAVLNFENKIQVLNAVVHYVDDFEDDMMDNKDKYLSGFQLALRGINHYPLPLIEFSYKFFWGWRLRRIMGYFILKWTLFLNFIKRFKSFFSNKALIGLFIIKFFGVWKRTSSISVRLLSKKGGSLKRALASESFFYVRNFRRAFKNFSSDCSWLRRRIHLYMRKFSTLFLYKGFVFRASYHKAKTFLKKNHFKKGFGFMIASFFYYKTPFIFTNLFLKNKFIKDVGWKYNYFVYQKLKI
jgi:hypothetical protein